MLHCLYPPLKEHNCYTFVWTGKLFSLSIASFFCCVSYGEVLMCDGDLCS